MASRSDRSASGLASGADWRSKSSSPRVAMIVVSRYGSMTQAPDSHVDAP